MIKILYVLIIDVYKEEKENHTLIEFLTELYFI